MRNHETSKSPEQSVLKFDCIGDIYDKDSVKFDVDMGIYFDPYNILGKQGKQECQNNFLVAFRYMLYDPTPTVWQIPTSILINPSQERENINQDNVRQDSIDTPQAISIVIAATDPMNEVDSVLFTIKDPGTSFYLGLPLETIQKLKDEYFIFLNKNNL